MDFCVGVLQVLPGASGLVRVGGQSSGGNLESVSLENQKREIPFRKSLPVHLRLMHKQVCCFSVHSEFKVCRHLFGLKM